MSCHQKLVDSMSCFVDQLVFYRLNMNDFSSGFFIFLENNKNCRTIRFALETFFHENEENLTS